MTELIKNLNENRYDLLLQSLKQPQIGDDLCADGSENLITSILIVSNECISTVQNASTATIFDDIIHECFRLLRNACAAGAKNQNFIIDYERDSKTRILQLASLVLFNECRRLSATTRKMCWQLIANLGVGNEYTQRHIRDECIEQILNNYKCVCDTENRRECTMILYNYCISKCNNRNDTKKIVEFLLECAIGDADAVAAHGLNSNEFYRIFMDNFITNNDDAVPVYDKIESATKRLYLLEYIADHVADVDHELVSMKFIQFICRDFKRKYDCVVKTQTSDHLKEVMTALDVIARASSDERYSKYLNSDGALFLDVGVLLRQIVEIGKREPNADQPKNIFAPIRNLEQLAPNSGADASLERDASYGLKSTLIRIVANLSFRNKKNQDLARDANIMMAIFDSTNLDARNPLIKEWSILAIRNLCEGNSENQELIRQLNKIGDDNKSSVLKEFDSETGTMRIRTDG